MTATLTKYLDSLGAPSILSKRIRAFLQTYEVLLPERVIFSFVSEYRDDADERTFESLWLFSENFAMEAQLLGSEEDQLDLVPYRSSIHHVIVRKRAFDLMRATEASRMTVEVWFTGERYGVLRATGANCLRLTEVLQEQLITNVIVPA